MTARSKLKSALDAIDDAIKKLKRVRHSEEAGSSVRKAIKELEDAESDIASALRQID